MDAALYWNDVVDDLNARDHTGAPIPGDQAGPTRTSRAGAIAMLAVHDAFFGIQGQPTYLGSVPPADARASPQFAAGVACAQVLSALYPKHRPFIDERLASAPRGTGNTTTAAAYGRAIAEGLIALRRGDELFDERHPTRRNQIPTPSPAYGHHRPDPMSPDQGLLNPFWGGMPFFATPAPAFLAPPPGQDAAGMLNPRDPVYAAHNREVYLRGGSPTSSETIREEEETVIGVFWAYDGAQKLGTPPRIYNRLIKTISKQKGLTEAQNVRLLALANVAMADAGIHAWFYKYHYDLWRPVVGIRERTRTFGPSANPGAPRLPFSDPFWKPLGAPRTNELTTTGFTPNFPAYPSGHATFGAAVLHITRLYLASIGKATLHPDGSDDVGFDFISEELDGQSRHVDGSVRTRHVRRFSNLLEAITENAVSRVYLGVHWRFDGTTGGYDSDGAGGEGPSARFDPDPDSVVLPRDSIGGVPLGLDIAEGIFKSGLKRSNASLARGVPPPPSTPPKEPWGRGHLRKKDEPK
ncbi:MAG TPA: phosphatase PAP2 family protein [Archangium sp.]|uniref:vanadium-dependent haloperoxidase n=1 Tax=Archangium sp. TaxID=1872627 RepID=UPI002ED8A10F